MRNCFRHLATSLVVLACGLLVGPGRAQQPSTGAPPPSSSSEEGEGGPTSSDSTVGYIDSAIPRSQLRLRYDSGYQNVTPTRGEFFYATTAPLGPGLAVPESRVDFQDISAYVEYAFGERLSAFVELPFRFGNFEDNPNHHSISDLTTGLKYAWVRNDCTVATTQFRLYVPTGDRQLGLGTGHVSLEPALLLYHQLSDRLVSESELRYWLAVGGTPDVEGSVIRYGTGIHYDVYKSCQTTVAPTLELVGWTFLDGQKTPPTVAGTGVLVQSASGDTIVNVKLGVRVKLGERADVYSGYGRALTGEVLYKDIVRVELRLLY